jgi:hypothetical protein
MDSLGDIRMSSLLLLNILANKEPLGDIRMSSLLLLNILANKEHLSTQPSTSMLQINSIKELNLEDLLKLLENKYYIHMVVKGTQVKQEALMPQKTKEKKYTYLTICQRPLCTCAQIEGLKIKLTFKDYFRLRLHPSPS